MLYIFCIESVYKSWQYIYIYIRCGIYEDVEDSILTENEILFFKL